MPGEVTALLSALCYSLSYIFLNKAQSDAKTIDDGLLPVLGISSVTLVAAVLFQHVTSPTSVPMDRIGLMPVAYCATGAFLSTFLGRFCFYSAIEKLGATRGVVIKSLAPVVTVVLAVFWLGENPKGEDWLGFALLGGSIAMLITERMKTDERGFFRTVTAQGLFLAFLAAGLQGVGHVMRKLSVGGGLPPLIAAATEVVLALCMYTVYLVVVGKLKEYLTYYRKAHSLYLLAAGFLSAAAVLLFFVASNTAPVSTVSVLIGLQPVIVAMISKAFFRGLERITWLTFVYVFCMVIGISLVAV